MVCSNSVLNTESQSVTLIYVDGTKGWQDIHDSTSNVNWTNFYICNRWNNYNCQEILKYTHLIQMQHLLFHQFQT